MFLDNAENTTFCSAYLISNLVLLGLSRFLDYQFTTGVKKSEISKSFIYLVSVRIYKYNTSSNNDIEIKIKILGE